MTYKDVDFFHFLEFCQELPKCFFSDSSLFDLKQVGRMTRNTGAVWRLFRDLECLKSSQKHILWKWNRSALICLDGGWKLNMSMKTCDISWLAITLRLLDGRTIYSIFCTQMAKGLKSSNSMEDVSLAAGESWLRSIWLSGVGNSWRIWCVDGNWDASDIFSVYFAAGGCDFLEGPLATCLHWGLEYWIGWCFLGLFQEHLLRILNFIWFMLLSHVDMRTNQCKSQHALSLECQFLPTRSAPKKAWCCEHSTRGCEPTTAKPMFDCDAGSFGHRSLCGHSTYCIDSHSFIQDPVVERMQENEIKKLLSYNQE